MQIFGLRRRTARGLARTLVGPWLVILTLAATRSHAAPGDLIGFLPTNFSAPQDLTHDEDDDTFWITSYLEPEVQHFSSDLTQRIGSIPVPFDNFIFPFAYGIAHNTRRHTLHIVDSFNGQIHELEKDGTPAGPIIDIPFVRPSNNTAGALSYYPLGDDGEGSLYLVENFDGLIYELGMDGELLRTFPDVDDPDRYFGIGTAAHPFAFDLRLDDGILAGFLVASGSAGLLELDLDGRFTGNWMSLDRAGEEPGGMIRRQLADPVSGEMRDTVLCIVGTQARFAFLEAGWEGFPGVTRFGCELDNRTLALEWSLWKEFDAVEVREGCDVVDVLGGGETAWQGRLEEDGVYRFSVHAMDGDVSSSTAECTVVVGTGEMIRQVDFKDHGLIDIATDGAGALIVSDTRSASIRVLDLDLELQRFVEVSKFFASDGDAIGALALDRRTSTLFLYNHTRSLMGKFDYPSLELLDTFDVLIPGLGGPSRKRPSIAGMTFRPGEQPGTGTLLMVEGRRDVILEVDLAGVVRREIPHPFLALEDPTAGSNFGPSTSGISMVGGSDGAQVYLSGGTFRERDQQRFFRMDLESGEMVPGSSISTAGLGARWFTLLHLIDPEGVPRFYAVSSRSVREIDLGPPVVAPPIFLSCTHGDPGDEVELTFTPGEAYDRVEIFRDCTSVALLDGATVRHVDMDPGAGVHDYAVRGQRGDVWSDRARCTLRVGVGAVLGRHLTWPVENPGQLARDPVDGTLFISGSVYIEEEDRLSDETVHQFDRDFSFVATLAPPVDSPVTLASMAVRRTPAGERLLYFIVNSFGQFTLLAKTVDGDFVDEAVLDPPQPRPPFPSAPAGLTWSAGTDTFYYLERNSDTLVEIDVHGKEMRRFPHPFPAPNRFLASNALWFSDDRDTLLTPTITQPSDLHVGLTRIVEMDLDGMLTGVEIPLDERVHGIALDGKGLILLKTSPFDEFVRIKAFREAAVVAGEFIRGDSNRNFVVELADPIFFLNYLFRAGPPPPCPDAADANDDGRFNITDAVRVLNYLFLAGVPPEAPFPGRGEDPTADDLACDT